MSTIHNNFLVCTCPFQSLYHLLDDLFDEICGLTWHVYLVLLITSFHGQNTYIIDTLIGLLSLYSTDKEIYIKMSLTQLQRCTSKYSYFQTSLHNIHIRKSKLEKIIYKYFSSHSLFLLNMENKIGYKLSLLIKKLLLTSNI